MKRQGLSLLETMIAGTIFILCMGSILVLLPSGFMSLMDSERRLYAGSLAQRVLEEKRNMPLQALDQLGTAPIALDPVDYQGVRYDVVLLVQPEPSSTFARHLKVTVSWEQHHQRVSLVRESTECRVRR